MARNPIKIQANTSEHKGEGVLVEDDEHIWAIEVTPSPVVRAWLKSVGKKMGAGDFEQINPNMMRAKKRPGSPTS